MIKQFRQEHPVEFIYVVAGLVGLLVWVSLNFMQQGAPDHIWLRVCMGTASVLMFNATLETYEIARRNVGFRHIAFWQSAFSKGYAIAYIMILIMWNGVEHISNSILVWGVTGMAFGVIYTFITPAQVSVKILDKYDLEKPMAKNKFEAIINISLMPISIIVLVIMFYYKENKTSTQDLFFTLWFLMFWGFLSVKYVKRDWNYLQISERFIGVVIIIFGFAFLR